MSLIMNSHVIDNIPWACFSRFSSQQLRPQGKKSNCAYFIVGAVFFEQAVKKWLNMLLIIINREVKLC